MFILFGEVSAEECSPVISVVAGSIDRPHLAANSKNHQEESQPCCHIILWMVFSIQMDTDMLYYDGHRIDSIVSDSLLMLKLDFTQVGIGAMMLMLV